jgi:hypothetical protein
MHKMRVAVRRQYRDAQCRHQGRQERFAVADGRPQLGPPNEVVPHELNGPLQWFVKRLLFMNARQRPLGGSVGVSGNTRATVGLLDTILGVLDAPHACGARAADLLTTCQCRGRRRLRVQCAFHHFGRAGRLRYAVADIIGRSRIVRNRYVDRAIELHVLHPMPICKSSRTHCTRGRSRIGRSRFTRGRNRIGRSRCEHDGVADLAHMYNLHAEMIVELHVRHKVDVGDGSGADMQERCCELRHVDGVQHDLQTIADLGVDWPVVPHCRGGRSRGSCHDLEPKCLRLLLRLYDDVKYDANDDDSNYVKYYETVYVNYDAHPSHNKLHHYYKHSQIINNLQNHVHL